MSGLGLASVTTLSQPSAKADTFGHPIILLPSGGCCHNKVVSVLEMQTLNKFTSPFILFAAICCARFSVAQKPAAAMLTTLYTFGVGYGTVWYHGAWL